MGGLESEGRDELLQEDPQRFQSQAQAWAMEAVSFPDSEASTQWLEQRFHRNLEGPTQGRFGTGLERLGSASRVDQDEFFFPRWGFQMFEVSWSGVVKYRFHRVAPLH